ncbi:hypothetical protein EDB85DRAFT_1892740 [Lactarius pseudohatsudake]|nr:hypothetical protein EDB85DRAFT_1892740 [Lactarius pseudohatsudake]
MHPTVVDPEQGNVLIPLQRITQGRHRRLTTAQLQVPQRNDADTSPHLKKVRHYDALVLAWLVAFSPVHGFSPTMPDIPSGELPDDGTGGTQAQSRRKVAVFVLNMIGLRKSIPWYKLVCQCLLRDERPSRPSRLLDVGNSSVVDMLERAEVDFFS